MKRPVLIRTAIALFVLGMIGLGGLFAASLSPSEKALSERARGRIPDLKPGQFAYVKSPQGDSEDWMFVRRLNGELNVWHIPTKNGRHVMGDMHWWSADAPCNNFGPRFEAGVINCADEEFSDERRKHYSWTLDGKSLDVRQGYRDMIPVIGFEETGAYVVGKKGG